MKRIKISLLLLIIAGSVSAQWFSFGAKAGYNTILDQNQRISDVFDVRSGLGNGFNLGLYARLGHRLYAQPELVYNYTAYQKHIGNIGTVDSYHASTFDIPVLVGYSVVNTSLFKLRLMAGPRFTFNAGSTKPRIYDNIVEKVSDARVGLDCGLGFDVWRLTLDVRYNLQRSLYNYTIAEATQSIKGRPEHAFNVTVGFRILGQN